MADEVKETKVDSQQEDQVQQNFVEAIQNLKKNTVSKEAYDDVVAQNKQLLEALVNGSGNSTEEPPKEAVDVKALRNEIFSNKDMTNLEFVEQSLKLRKAIIEQGGDDPFVGRGTKLSPTREDYEAADHVATVLQEMVDNAQGDNDAFLIEYNRRVNDINIPFKR